MQVNLPQGAQILAILPEGDALIAADPQQPGSPRYYSIVLSAEGTGGVVLTDREVAGTYVGSFRGYARARGQRQDLYHVFEVAAP